jgi:ferredoxin-like protein FixX
MIKHFEKFLLCLLALSIVVTIVSFFMPSSNEGTRVASSIIENQASTSGLRLGFDKEKKSIVVLYEVTAATSTLEIIQSIPPNTEVELQQASPDGKSIYYVLRTKLDYDVRYESFASIYLLDINRKNTTQVLSDRNIDLKYPMKIIFSPEEKRVAIQTYGCTECGGGGMFETIIYNQDIPRNQQQFKNLGPGMDFKFTGPTTYEYYEGVRGPEQEMTQYYIAGSKKYTGDF